MADLSHKNTGCRERSTAAGAESAPRWWCRKRNCLSELRCAAWRRKGSLCRALVPSRSPGVRSAGTICWTSGKKCRRFRCVTGISGSRARP